MKDQIILRVVAKLLMPYLLLWAFYVQWHGDYGPGGGFQAGVIFAAGVVLFALIFGLAAARQAIRPGVVHAGISAGLLIYAGVGVANMLAGAAFLDYDTFGHHGQHWGILIVELGVGVTVSAVMLSIYTALAGRGRPAQ